MIGVCESCGRDDEVILRVRRLYLTPEAWDTAERIVEDEEEAWCFSCRTHYPHEVLEGPDASSG